MEAKKRKAGATTPVYVLDTFSRKAGDHAFYMESLKSHLRDHAFVNKPHKHDFYLLLFVTHGEGVHIIDFKPYRVYPGTAFTMTPGQVHSWTLSNDADGYIIFFRQEFYQMQLNERALLDFPFFHSLGATPLIQLKNDNVLSLILEEMHDEFHKDRPDLRMLRSYLDIVLLKLARAYDAKVDSSLELNVHKIRKVEQLIEEHFRKFKQPAEYASLMNLTPSYLNSICKAGTGKTLTDLIGERIILEAKRLFAYTDLSVKEVAQNLGYQDSSYFPRFFRKKAGVTPDNFRRSINRPE